MESWIKTGVVLVALAIVGFLGSWEASALVSTRGELGPTVLQAQSPISALVAVLITLGVSSFIAGFVARFTTTISGMLVLGFSLFVMAMKMDGIEGFIYGGGNVNLLIIEALLLSVLVLLCTLIVFAIGGPVKDVQQASVPNESNFWKVSLISLAILPVVYIIAQTPMRGQAIGASAVGGVAIGFLARQFIPTIQPVMLYPLPIAVGGLGYFFGSIINPLSDVAFAQQSISPLLYPMPIAYGAGIVMGVSIGLSWAVSFAEKPETDAQEA
ncbi:MAG: hypothetical protein CMJ26_00345 [Phycisphaerae bacterium]|nr:hypothetical protein [Phycisphaerae bacterium]|tara:strand:+ start:372 stop:1181 length:810 start_codon:yes stop_codon:yes gene_type:complete